MLPFPIQDTCQGWVLPLDCYLSVWNGGIKGTKIFHIAWRIPQKLELSKPQWLWKLVLPPACPPGEKVPERGQSCGPGLEDEGRSKSTSCVGGEAWLYPIPIYFSSFINNEKKYILFKFIYLLFYYAMSGPWLWRINSSVREERGRGLPTELPAAEWRPHTIIAAIKGLVLVFMCVFGFVV